jgi:hypothetical protein
VTRQGRKTRLQTRARERQPARPQLHSLETACDRLSGWGFVMQSADTRSRRREGARATSAHKGNSRTPSTRAIAFVRRQGCAGRAPWRRRSGQAPPAPTAASPRTGESASTTPDASLRVNASARSQQRGGRDHARFCIVAGGELSRGLLLGRVGDWEQKPGSATTGPLRCLGLRETRSQLTARSDACLSRNSQAHLWRRRAAQDPGCA